MSAPAAAALAPARVWDAASDSVPIGGERVRVERRSIPYPYRAALAICSDLDETADLDVYVETIRFLNGVRHTRFGEGVELEAGNTIYFDMAPSQFSYWNTTDRGRAIIRELIRSGHIDCLHSFGDLATTRDHAARALDELTRHDCRLEVWIDHAIAPSNFGADIMCGYGDVAGSRVFHADLSCAFGIQYVWRGRVTSVAGQGVPRRLRGVANWRHPAASAVTLAKEACKGALGAAGGRYDVHATNNVLRRVTLRSGHRAYEFLRCNPHWGGVSRCDTAAGIPEVLVESMLQRLSERGGFCILYTHLGKGLDAQHPIQPAAVDAFRRLATHFRDGRILVTTTRRLLGYCRAVEDIDCVGTSADGLLRIDVSTSRLPPESRSDLDGLTFYVPDPARAVVCLDGIPQHIDVNPRDHTGRFSVSIPRRRLSFPKGVL